MINTVQDLRIDLQRMYELSLAIGNSLDPNIVCSDFCTALMRQIELSYVGIWTLAERPSSDSQQYDLFFAFPYSRALTNKLAHEHPALHIKDGEAYAEFSFTELDNSHRIEDCSSDSSGAIFRLGDIGYIRLIRERGTFSQKELRQLRPIIEKLSISLGGALAHSQLQRERTFLNSLINTIPELVWLKDIDGKYLACNTRFEEFFGAKEHQIVDRTDYDFVDKELADFFRQKDREALSAKKPKINQEWITFANDGHRALLETIKTPMKSESGEIIGVLGVGHEITQLHEAQQALSVNEQRFRSYFELNLIGMALISKDNEWLQVNSYLCELLEYSEATLKQHALEELIHPNDLSLFTQLTHQLSNNETHMARAEVRFFNQSGLIIQTEIAISRQVNSHDEIDHFVTLVSDITDRKRIEERLKLAASVFEHAGEGVMITDNKGLILEVNHAFQKLTGYTQEDVIGRTPNMLKSGHHSEEFFSAMWHSLHKNGRWRGEVWNRNKSGEIYAELLNIASVLDDNGEASHYVSIFSDITQLKEHQQELEKMAHFDALTQLPNRVLLSDRLNNALELSRKHQQMMAVAYIDLDEFKPINDKYGHDIGDLLLIEAAKRMQEILQTNNAIARLGGDEFVVILTELESVHECRQILSRIIKALSSPFNIRHFVLSISASIGVTLFPEDDADADTLIRHADQAMYTAKQTGRNRFHFFDPDFDRQTQDQHKAQDEIRAALLNKEFVLYYQPKVNLRSGKVYGVEALIRWQHPTLNLLPPDSFLPQITSPDLASSLGAWVMEEAISQLRVWRSAGLDLGVSINISAEHLQNSFFTEQLQKILSHYPEVPPQAIEFEVLESAEFNDINTALEVIEQCHKLGIKFALDDFGTGYSSLTYLRKIPADTIKIDKSFVIDMLADPEDKTIVEGIIGLGRAFDREVIAEGVETSAHMYCLMQMNCENAQGYGIAKPMPANLIPDWIANFRLEEQLN